MACTWSATATALAMGAHARLGAESPLRAVASQPDLLKTIMHCIALVVPDDEPTLAAALSRAGAEQRVLLRRGTHEVFHAAIDQPISDRKIWLDGEPGAILRGCLVLGSAGGKIERLRLDDAGDCCVRCLGGWWHFSALRLRCSHAASLQASSSAHVTLEDCVLGGEGEHEIGRHIVMLSAYGSVQVQGLAKRASFAVVARGQAELQLVRCTLGECSESLVLLCGRARCLLQDCRLSAADTAFHAGTGLGRHLELHRCTVGPRVARLWVDEDRPSRHIMVDVRVDISGTSGPSSDGEEGEEAGWGRIVPAPASVPRGAEENDSSSTSSLEEQEYADMERLMEQLDATAISSAAVGGGEQGG